MKTIPALPLLISCLLFTGCDQATQEALQDKALSYAKVQVYETRMNLEIEARRKEVELLKGVTDAASLQRAEKEIQAVQQALKEQQKALPDIGRLSYQDEQLADPQIKEDVIAVFSALRAERTRIAELDGVVEYQRRQSETRRNERLLSLYHHLDESQLTDKAAISRDPAAYLAAINVAMDDWQGVSEELETIKNRLDQYLTLNPEDNQGMLALAIYYSLKSAFKRSENLVKAQQICSHLEKTAPDLPGAHVVHAGVQMRWNNYPLARKSLEKAKQAGVDSFWYHFFWADVLLREGDQAQGETLLKKLTEGEWRKSQLAYAYSRLAALKLHQNKHAESLALHEKAVALHPGFHWRHGNYGFSLLQLAGDITNAEKELNVARAIRSYGSLNRLEQDLLFVKWAYAKSGAMQPAWAKDLAGFDPSAKQMKAMMVRVGRFRHGPTIDALVTVLLKQGIPLDSQDRSGSTAMHLAAENGYSTTLAALHRYGASLEITDESGATPLITALRKRRMDAVDQLILLGANIKHETPFSGATPFTLAVFGGHYALVERLLALGVDVNYKAPSQMGNRDETPLSIAVLNGDEQMVKILLKAGADRSVTVMGRTLPEAAQELGHKGVVALLKT